MVFNRYLFLLFLFFSSLLLCVALEGRWVGGYSSETVERLFVSVLDEGDSVGHGEGIIGEVEGRGGEEELEKEYPQAHLKHTPPKYLLLTNTLRNQGMGSRHLSRPLQQRVLGHLPPAAGNHHQQFRGQDHSRMGHPETHRHPHVSSRE